MRTLHLYFARELLKTFALTAMALTLLVVMGGGVANIFKGEGIGLEEVAKVFAFLTPVAVTLILPIAALFAAAMSYGRAAADNEVIACRAAGINIHRLLLSAGLLGFTVTLITYFSWNFVIPRLSQLIEDTTRKELHTIVISQFQKAKPLAFGKYRIMANRCEVLGSDRLPPETPPNHTYLLLSGVSFLEIEDQEVLRFGTADTTIIDFDREEKIPRVTADLQDVRSFDAFRRQYYELKHQILGPFEIPLPIRRKIKFENLPALLEYRHHPERIPDVEARFAGLQRMVMAVCLSEDLLANIDPGRGGQGRYTLQSETLTLDLACDAFKVDSEDGKVTLGRVRVEETSRVDGHRRLHVADTATFEIRTGIRQQPVLMIDLKGSVASRNVPLVEGDRMVKKDALTLQAGDFLAQPTLRERWDKIDLAALLDESADLPLPPDQNRQLERLRERVDSLRGEVRSEIHFRASYALTNVAVVLLGAILGVIVRGGQVLTAFGISCLPSLFVVLSSIVGRNLASRVETADASILVMWGAAVFIYAATVFIALRWLKR
jgi:lipopolysaccharide export LptBFGC system permease protein LptF